MSARAVRSVVDEALTSDAEPRAPGTTPHPTLKQNNARLFAEGRAFLLLYGFRTTGRYAFLAAFTLAHLARCAAAIFLRAAADIVRLFGIVTTFCVCPLPARTFAQRAR
jgi:hypothetical protein